MKEKIKEKDRIKGCKHKLPKTVFTKNKIFLNCPNCLMKLIIKKLDMLIELEKIRGGLDESNLL